MHDRAIESSHISIVLTTGIFPPEIGGPATYVERLARTLTQHGETVSVITTSGEDAISQKADLSTGYEVIAVTRRQPLAKRMWRCAGTTYKRARGADLVYANGIYLEAAAAARLARKPLMLKVVGDYAWETAWNDGSTETDLSSFQNAPAGSHKVRIVRSLQRWWCHRADMIIVASNYLASIVSGWGVSPERIVVVPNAVEVPGDPPRYLGLVPEQPRVISGGRLVWWKHLDVLVRALPHFPAMTLTLLGEGDERGPLEALGRELGVEARLHFHPPVGPHEISKLLKGYDVFALPASSETFSYMTIEAMGAGLPVAVSAEGALPEVVGYGRWGKVVSARDPQTWAEAISGLTADPHVYRSVAEAGYVVAKSAYNWESIYARTLEIVKQACNG